MIGVQAKVRANGPVYYSASMVMAAIGATATALTRDPEYLWAWRSTMTEQERQAKAQRDAIEKAKSQFRSRKAMNRLRVAV